MIFFFLWGFMVQKKSQTTTRVIKLSMERLETPTKVVSDMWDWATKCLRMWPMWWGDDDEESSVFPHLFFSYLGDVEVVMFIAP